MAGKKPGSGSFDKYELDNFDDLTGNGGFDDFGMGKDDRKPIVKIASSIVEGATGWAKDSRNQINFIKKAMPDGYDTAIDAIDDGISGLKDLYDTAGREFKPITDDMKKLLRQHLPAEGNYKPGGLVDKLKRWAKEEQRHTGMSREQQESMQLNTEIGEIFRMQAEHNAQKEAVDANRQNLQSFVSNKLAAGANAQLDAIRVNTSRLVAYQDQVLVNFQKKQLELGYRQYFVQRRLLDQFEAHANLSKRNMEIIAKNTGLPDFVKMRNKEVVEQILKTKLLGAVGNSLGGWARGAGKRIMNSYSAKIKQFASDAGQNLQMLLTAGEMGSMGQDMGMSGKDMAMQFGGNMVGGAAAQKAAAWLKNFVKPKIGASNKIVNGGMFINNLRMMFPQLMNDFAKSGTYDDGIMGWLMEGLKEGIGTYSKNKTVRKSGADILDEAVHFNMQSRQALTEVIPGWLGRIHQELRITRTGDTTIQPMSFSYAKGQFEEAKETKARIQKAVMDDRKIGGTQTRIKDTLASIGGDELSPAAQKALERELLEAATSDAGFSVEDIIFNGKYKTIKDQKLKKEIKEHFQKKTGVVSKQMKDGTTRHSFDLEGDGQAVLNNLLKRFDELARSIPDLQAMMVNEARQGNLDNTGELGYTRWDEDRQQHVVDETAWKEEVLGGKYRGDDPNRPGAPKAPRAQGPAFNLGASQAESVRDKAAIYGKKAKRQYKKARRFTKSQLAKLSKEGKKHYEVGLAKAQKLGAEAKAQYEELYAMYGEDALPRAKEFVEQLELRVRGGQILTPEEIESVKQSVAGFAERAHTEGRRIAEQMAPIYESASVNATEIAGQMRPAIINALGTTANVGTQAIAGARTTGIHAMDNISARLQAGEFVLNADAVKRYGVGLLNRMNNPDGKAPAPRTDGKGVQGFASGGLVDKLFGSTPERLSPEEYQRKVLEGFTEMKEAILEGNIKEEAGITAQMTAALNSLLQQWAPYWGSGSNGEAMPPPPKGPLEDRMILGLWKGFKGGVKRGVTGIGKGFRSLYRGGKFVRDNILPLGFKIPWNVAKFGKGLWDASRSKHKDIYVQGEEKPRMVAVKMKQGHYTDTNTGKVIKTIRDITGEVKDEKGDVVITDEEFQKGLYDKFGKALPFRIYDAISKIVDKATSPFAMVAKIAHMVTTGTWKWLKANKDVYVAGEEKPRLYARLIRAGAYRLKKNGKTVTSIKDVIGDIIDENNNIVLSMEDIQKGLVDSDGKPIKTLGEKVLGLVAGTFKIGGKVARFVGNTFAKGMNALQNLFGAGTEVIKGLLFGIGKYSGFSIFGYNKPVVDRLDKIHDLLDKRLPGGKKKFNDADGDGSREGSREEQLQEREKEDAEAAANEQKGIFGRLKDSLKAGKEKVTSFNPLAMLSSLGDKLSGLVTGFTGFMGTMGKWFTQSSLMMKAIALFTRGGGGGVPGVDVPTAEGKGKPGGPKPKGGRFGKLRMPGLGAAGKLLGAAAMGYGAYEMSQGNYLEGGLSLTMGAVGTFGMGGIAAGLATAGGVALSILSSPVVLAAGAVLATGYGIYKLVKYVKRPRAWISQFRMRQYGYEPDDEDKMSAIATFEKILLKDVKVSAGAPAEMGAGIPLSEAMKIFGVKMEDGEAIEEWKAWYSYRFRPIFLTHVTVMYDILRKTDITNVDDLALTDQRKEIMKRVHFPLTESSPYAVNASPFKKGGKVDVSMTDINEDYEDALSLIEKDREKHDKGVAKQAEDAKKTPAQKEAEAAKKKEKDSTSWFTKMQDGASTAIGDYIDRKKKQAAEAAAAAKKAYEASKKGLAMAGKGAGIALTAAGKGLGTVASAASGLASSAASGLASGVSALGSGIMSGLAGAGTAIAAGGSYIYKVAKGEAAKYRDSLLAAIDRHGYGDPVAKAQILANVENETGNYSVMTENLNYKADAIMKLFATARKRGRAAVEEAVRQGPQAIAEIIYGGREDLGNIQPGDGYKYRGRGLLQLTGRANYAAASKHFGIDLVNNPDLVFDPKIAAEIVMYYFNKRVPRAAVSDPSDAGIELVRKRVNGGLIGIDHVKKTFKGLLPLVQAGKIVPSDGKAATAADASKDKGAVPAFDSTGGPAVAATSAATAIKVSAPASSAPTPTPTSAPAAASTSLANRVIQSKADSAKAATIAQVQQTATAKASTATADVVANHLSKLVNISADQLAVMKNIEATLRGYQSGKTSSGSNDKNTTAAGAAPSAQQLTSPAPRSQLNMSRL